MASLPSATARGASRRLLRRLAASARGPVTYASSSVPPRQPQSLRHQSSAPSSSNYPTDGVEAKAPPTAVPPIARTAPAVYAALLPHQRSALVSLLARLNLPTNDTELISTLSSSLTHPSWIVMRDAFLDNAYKRQTLGPSLAAQLESSRSQQLEAKSPMHNAALATVGNSLLGMLASEHLHLVYPNLPNRALKAALSAHVGPNTLADHATELGLGAKGLMKWDVSGEDKVEGVDGKWRKRNSRDVLAHAMRAVVGLIFQTRGLAQTRSFVLSHFLSRLPLPPPISSGPLRAGTLAASSSHPLASLLKFDDPKRSLSLTLERYKLERPLSRLIAETGRYSQAAVFGVGVYTGERKIGEGWGSSIRMAEYRASEDALRRMYLARSSPLAEEEIPSATLDAEFPGSNDFLDSSSAGGIISPSQGKDIWAVGEVAAPAVVREAFRPRNLGESEIVFGNKS